MTKAIRHQLDIYDTVLRLAYDEATWRTLVDDFDGAPGNMDRDKPPLDNSGSTFESVWQQKAGRGSSERSVQHVSIWINVRRHGPDRPELVATVAHEAVHAAADIFRNVAATGTPAEAGEPFAYLVDWIVRWIWDNLP